MINQEAIDRHIKYRDEKAEESWQGLKKDSKNLGIKEREVKNDNSKR